MCVFVSALAGLRFVQVHWLSNKIYLLHNYVMCASRWNFMRKYGIAIDYPAGTWCPFAMWRERTLAFGNIIIIIIIRKTGNKNNIALISFQGSLGIFGASFLRVSAVLTHNTSINNNLARRTDVRKDETQDARFGQLCGRFGTEPSLHMSKLVLMFVSMALWFHVVGHAGVHLVRIIAPLKRNHFRRTRNGNVEQSESQTDGYTSANHTSPSKTCREKVRRRKREQWSAAKHNKQPLATCNRARHRRSGGSVCRLPHATDGACLCTRVSVLKINCLACSLAEVLHEKSLVTMRMTRMGGGGSSSVRDAQWLAAIWTLSPWWQWSNNDAKCEQIESTDIVQHTNTAVSVFVTLSDFAHISTPLFHPNRFALAASGALCAILGLRAGSTSTTTTLATISTNRHSY